LRGASAIQRLLDRGTDPKLRVLVVWEPVLATDWRAPSGSTLARISDRRARQFWDPKHLVSLQLSRIRMAKPGQQEPACCQDEGFYWDEAILYAPKTEWKEMPVSVFWNDPEIGKLFPASKTRSGTIDDAVPTHKNRSDGGTQSA